MDRKVKDSRTRIRVWDAGTRVTHWAIVASFAFSWWSAENHEMGWHFWSGMTMLGLIVFRLFWGIAGSSPSRFSDFVAGPRTVLIYVRNLFGGHHRIVAGHNPLGGWSVMALLFLLAAQVVLGLFAVDVDGIESGPLSWLVEFETGRTAADLHGVIFNILLALVALHITAICFYLIVKKENLVQPMISGSKTVAQPPAKPFQAARPAAYLFGILIAALVTWAVSTGLPIFG